MFRHGTNEELWALHLELHHGQNRMIPASASESVEAMRHFLSDDIRDCLCDRALNVVLTVLETSQPLRESLLTLFRHTHDPDELGSHHTPEALPRDLVRSYTAGVVQVLERDFIQLLNGPRQDVMVGQRRHTLELLLGGQLLGHLYRHVPQPQAIDSVAGLTHLALLKLTEESLWLGAIRRHGPALPAPRQRVASLRANSRKRSQTLGSLELNRSASFEHGELRSPNHSRSELVPMEQLSLTPEPTDRAGGAEGRFDGAGAGLRPSRSSLERVMIMDGGSFGSLEVPKMQSSPSSPRMSRRQEQLEQATRCLQLPTPDQGDGLDPETLPGPGAFRTENGTLYLAFQEYYEAPQDKPEYPWSLALAAQQQANKIV